MFRVAIAFAALPLIVRAAPPDPQPREAMVWRVMLRMPKHPLLNDAFRANLARELKAALQPGLGLLGAVEVIDAATSDDAIAKQFHSDGWSALEPAATRRLDGVKHHGLAIDYRDGAFHLAARQYDGFTGLASPMPRMRTARAADLIPRAAGLLLEPDFGLVGTVEVIPTDASHVNVVLRGGLLSPLEGKVVPGDLFAVSLLKATAGLTATPQASTYLKVVEPVKEGKCKCRILSRWASPFGRDSRQAAAIRAMKLPTVQAPLTIQLVDRAGKPHLRGSSLTLTASDVDFTAKPTESDKFEWQGGVYRSTRPFVNVACISIGVGADRPQLFPVPVLNDDVITIAFNIDPAAERRAEFLRDCTDLRARIADLGTAQVAMVGSMNQLLDTAKNREALARAESGRDTLAMQEKVLTEELKSLSEQPGATDTAAKEVLELSTRQLAVVRTGQTQLTTTIASLKDAIGKATDPTKLEKEFRGQELATRIKEYLSRGDVPEALSAYEKLIELYPADATHKDAREKLQAEWAPKDDAHRAARDCIRNLAAAKTPGEFKTAIEEVKKAVPVLAAKKDKLGLRKLSNTFDVALIAFRQLVAKLDGTAQAAEKVQETLTLDELLTELRQCETLTREKLKELR